MLDTHVERISRRCLWKPWTWFLKDCCSLEMLYEEYDIKLKNLSDFMVDAVDEYLAEKTELIVDAIEQGDEMALKEIKKQARDLVIKLQKMPTVAMLFTDSPLPARECIAKERKMIQKDGQWIDVTSLEDTRPLSIK